jgi:hypothetical protein
MLRFWAAQGLEISDPKHSREVYGALCGVSSVARDAMTLSVALGYAGMNQAASTAALRLALLNEAQAD